MVLSCAWATPMAATPSSAAAICSSVRVMVLLLWCSAAPVRLRFGRIRGEAGLLDSRDGAVLVAVRGIAADAHRADRGPGGVEDQHAARHRHEPAVGSGGERV